MSHIQGGKNWTQDTKRKSDFYASASQTQSLLVSDINNIGIIITCRFCQVHSGVFFSCKHLLPKQPGWPFLCRTPLALASMKRQEGFGVQIIANKRDIPITYQTLYKQRGMRRLGINTPCFTSISFLLPTQTKESKSRNDKYLVKPSYLTIEAKKNYHALLLLEHSKSPQLYYSIITSPILFLPPTQFTRGKKTSK